MGDKKQGEEGGRNQEEVGWDEEEEVERRERRSRGKEEGEREKEGGGRKEEEERRKELKQKGEGAIKLGKRYIKKNHVNANWQQIQIFIPLPRSCKVQAAPVFYPSFPSPLPEKSHPNLSSLLRRNLKLSIRSSQLVGGNHFFFLQLSYQYFSDFNLIGN